MKLHSFLERSSIMNKKRKQIIEQNEISELHTFSLGGVPQKVLVEGKSRELPVVINLHGGPGSPIPFSVGCRGLFPMFTDRFIMVYWDQRWQNRRKPEFLLHLIINKSISLNCLVFPLTLPLLKKPRKFAW